MVECQKAVNLRARNGGKRVRSASLAGLIQRAADSLQLAALRQAQGKLAACTQVLQNLVGESSAYDFNELTNSLIN
jgi:hypothetical protein